MRRILLHAVLVSSFELAGAVLAFPQTHKVAKPEDVVRAVGVYEWIGDEAKPTASRLIPVTLFIDGELQDAGVYLARPIPFAIESGTVYEVDKAGVTEGTVDVKYASHLQAADAAANFDDGWFGYGTFDLPPKPKKAVALKESKTPSQIISSRADEESDRPTLVRRHGTSTSASPDAANGTGGSGTNGSGTNGTSNTGSVSPEDPDRPHMTRRADSSDSSASASSPTGSSSSSGAGNTQPTGSDPSASTDAGTQKTATAGPAPANDPDRPTLKKRTPEEAKKARKEAEQSSATGLATSLNADPNRPTLHRGKGVQALTENDLPKLKGVPIDLRQAVAVSDAKTRPPHDFSRPWADDAERANVLAKMLILARAQVAAYQSAASKGTSAAAPPSSAKHTPNSKLRRAKTSENGSGTASIAFQDEQLSGYTLSYGGSATYVYTARTPGEGDTLRYVTVVAQVDAFGELQPAIQSVTDAAHLDRAPWMRLVDVVDADASNRASLLFEMRGQSARQFALYRVIAARSEQMFLTGTTQ